VTLQELVPTELVGDKVHVLVGLKGEAIQLADGLHVQVTMPVGDDTVPLEVSVTVAVQVVEWLSTTLVAAQTTLVEVVSPSLAK
jgi:hypothetical protein